MALRKSESLMPMSFAGSSRGTPSLKRLSTSATIWSMQHFSQTQKGSAGSEQDDQAKTRPACVRAGLSLFSASTVGHTSDHRREQLLHKTHCYLQACIRKQAP